MLPRCFIAMPMSTSLRQSVVHRDRHHFEHVLECLVVPAVEQAGFEPWRPKAPAASVVQAELVKALREADLMVADLSAGNPNVFFEVGVRTGQDLPVMLICDKRTELPFDVTIWDCYRYQLTRPAWTMRDDVAALAKHIRSSANRADGRNEYWKHFGTAGLN